MLINLPIIIYFCAYLISYAAIRYFAHINKQQNSAKFVRKPSGFKNITNEQKEIFQMAFMRGSSLKKVEAFDQLGLDGEDEDNFRKSSVSSRRGARGVSMAQDIRRSPLADYEYYKENYRLFVFEKGLILQNTDQKKNLI